MAGGGNEGRPGIASEAESDVHADPWSRMHRADNGREFAAAWLEVQATQLKGIRRAVILLGPRERGPFSPVATWPSGMTGSRALAETVERAIAERKSLARPASTTPEASRPREFIGLPITLDGRLYGGIAVEIERPSDRTTAEIVASLEWGATWFGSFIRRHWQPPGDRLITLLETVATSVHHPRFQEAVTAVATEMAARLGCERVSIGFLSGKHVALKGMSHSATFSRKASLVRAVEASMDEAIDQQATVVYPPDEDGPVQVTRAHALLHEEYGKSSICTVPFTDGTQLLGAMTLEMPKGSQLDEQARKLCEHTTALLGPILDVKRKEDRWLIRKAMDSAGDLGRRLVGPANVGLKITSIVAAVLLLIFVFVDGDYRVTADARLEGTVQRVIAAPMAGYIARADVRAGDTVVEGEVLVSLDDRDLRLEHLKWVSQRSQRQREQSEALAARDRAQAGILAAQIEQADAQIALLEEQLNRVVVTAPFSGIVVAGDLSQSLGAPVERGEALFELAPLDSYRIILEVDERDIGPVEVGQSGSLALTGMPEQTLDFSVEKITPISTASEGRNYFRVEANLAAAPPALLRPGMEGVAKIDAGRRNLFWIWTHKITYWIRMFFWSWWP
jgi:RND family efflux transporter MFP subunit